MKLYYNPMSSFSQKVLIAFKEKGATFEPEVVNLMDPDSRAALAAIYPLCRIPLLVRDDGRLIPESGIIIEYLDSAFPRGQQLLPSDPELARQVRCTERMNDAYLNTPVRDILVQGMQPEGDRDQAVIERSSQTLNVMYDFMDQQFADSNWCNGAEFSMSDCACLPALFYAQMVYPFADRPNITAYYQRACERPSWAAVKADAEAALAASGLLD
ncbi:MAG: glutathione S-transferase family protein [Gammaproteobacteria bacterium]|nr:glutathione S-transferase family protein [Gammaproteobacteria bacterium]